MTASNLQAEIMLALSRGDTRLLRANSAGMAWAGRIQHQNAHSITLSPYSRVLMMPPGTSDLLGWSPLVIDAGYIGRRIAVPTAIEVKWKRDTVKDAQQSFIDLVLASGGRAGVARNIDDAKRIVTMEVRK